MNRTMNGFISQSVAIVTMALVALFPTPGDFLSALKTPWSRGSSGNSTISATPVGNVPISFEDPTSRSTTNPDFVLTGYCLNGNPEEPEFFETCADQIQNALEYPASFPHVPGSVLPAEYKQVLLGELEARLGAACRAEWSRSSDPDEHLQHGPCRILFEGIAEN